jgi:hypothetical protein
MFSAFQPEYGLAILLHLRRFEMFGVDFYTVTSRPCTCDTRGEAREAGATATATERSEVANLPTAEYRMLGWASSN